MVEFGEKIKQLREEKGMTQQTIADMLYVTRQAVSRWECGARYPDILTTKKIAQILNVTIDELVSGEELKENIEKEPVLAQFRENIIQTVLYTIATIAYILMCIFSFYSIINPNEAFANTPIAEVSLVRISTIIGYVTNFVAVLVGVILSIRNKLTAKATGCIMSVPYFIAALSFVLTVIDMYVKHNGYMDFGGWIADFIIPLVFAVYVLLFFRLEKYRLPYVIIMLICVLSLGYIALVIRDSFMIITDLGFVVRTVHSMGKIGMVFLLGYQAFIWNKKKKIAYKVSK